MKAAHSAQKLLRGLVLCAGVLAASVIPSAAHGSPNTPARDLSLDGQWQVGLDRHYSRTVTVPGLAQDATKPSPGTLWYARSVTLPSGDWTTAVLTLHGARFAPEVYVDGERVSSAPGGMAPTVHVLRGGNVAPGKTIRLEIALRSLNDVGLKDASAVPLADRWRTNISSGLWDSATLHVSGAARLTEIVPFTDFINRRLAVHWRADPMPPQTRFRAWLEDSAGRNVAESQPMAAAGAAEIGLPLSIRPWSPEHPTLYRIHCVLDSPSGQLDETVSTWGLRDFTARDKHFFLNNQPVTMRGGTVVWQRFLRNPEAADIAFDPAWFQKNILLRLKSYGANTVRFHLALPPEALLDLCDQDGLLVQMEWPFFHGIPATAESMTEQWRAWLAVAMRHPSVVIVHGWNESGGAELTKAWSAMNAALQGFPPLVVAHRDTIHIHKYWWSLFENLGLYYDSADQFDRTIMVDEFGGDYLDRNGDPGLYPTVKETFLRFLGRRQTREGRLQFQAEANARVGEYWRRIGAAGVLPFCILGSPEDGGVWFLGSLHDPQPMPVWDALAATFSPQSVSLDLWDRNFTPGQKITVPFHFFNDTAAPATLQAELRIARADTVSGTTLPTTTTMSSRMAAHGHTQQTVTLTLPSTPGNWTVSATLQTPVAGVTHPIVSSWNVHVLTPEPSPVFAELTVGVPADEPELSAFLHQNHLRTVPLNDPSARVLLTSSATWDHLTPALLESLRIAVDHDRSVVMLDVGPRDLAQAGRPGELGPLDGSPVLKPGEAYHRVQRLFDGIQVEFNQLPEPESHMHPGADNASLWYGLPNDATWLWNGLRGGLVAPAANMEVSGLNQAAFLAQWTGRGADVAAIRSGTYYSYELAGYYSFSTTANDTVAIEALRKRVRFLAEDAPSLAAALDPDSPVRQLDLGAGYQATTFSKASRLEVLATCGKGLARTAVVAVDFGREQGRVLLSQALTAGRLRRGSSDAGAYGIRHDPAAEQFVLNLLKEAVAPARAANP